MNGPLPAEQKFRENTDNVVFLDVLILFSFFFLYIRQLGAQTCEAKSKNKLV